MQQIKHAAVRRLQRWARLLAARRQAQHRLDGLRADRKSNAARIITRLFRSVKIRCFKDKLQQSLRGDAARTIQCAARRFLAAHHVRVIRRQALRRRVEKHSVVIIQRNAKAKLKRLEPRKALADRVVGLVTGVLGEETISAGVAAAQVEGTLAALCALAINEVERNWAEEWLGATVPLEYEDELYKREALRLQVRRLCIAHTCVATTQNILIHIK